ncbi:MAG: aldehyde ferredoxin oxidoreductase C-terminal domain-containing protein, partial [Anaerolineae bacterium]|nr:aldehyde ferredoxin oxidoreductase C-terminal domain-containing protein [Anaerolineae bacterium]
AMDSLNICQFVFGPAWHLYSGGQLAETVRMITGWDTSVEDLLRLGERRLNMLRAFNFREGFGRDEDKLPKKLYKALQGGKSDGIQLQEEELETAKNIYYEMAGWEGDSAKPSRKKLDELNIGWVADLI